MKSAFLTVHGMAVGLLWASAQGAAAWTLPVSIAGMPTGPAITLAEAKQTGPGCPTLPTRSPFTGKNATAFFMNRNGKETLKLYWIDGVGNWQLKEEIAPGKSTSRGTIIGARFALVDPSGRCVMMPIVNLQSSTFAH